MNVIRIATVSFLSNLLVTSAVAAQIGPPLDVRTPIAPSPVLGDGEIHLVYELHVTNFSTTGGTLERVEAIETGNGAPLVAYGGEELAGNVRIIGTQDVASGDQGVVLGAGRTAVIYMWISVQPEAEPSSIHHRLGFAQVSAEGDTTRHDVHTEPLAVAPGPVVISAPVRGEWYAWFDPSNDSRHRRILMSLAGRTTIASRFTADWIRVVDGRYQTGDGGGNSATYAWGQEALAVADGSVVDIKDAIPNNEPGSQAVDITVETMGGNYVILNIGGGRYASYMHLQPGSLRVAVGDRVRVGDVVGLVGNSGNSGGPHLHFSIADGPSPFGAEGVPYLIDSFDVIGRLNRSGPPPLVTFPPERRELEMPMGNTLVRFHGNEP